MCWSDLSNRPDFGVIKQMLHAINDNRENTVTIKQVQMPKIMQCVRMTRIDFINFNFSLICNILSLNILQEVPLPAIGYSTVYAIQNSPYYPTLEEYDGQSDMNDDEDQQLPVCTCNNERHSTDCNCNYSSLRLQYV